MNNIISKSVAVIVAHPDDETLWAGGTMIKLPSWNWFIVCLCRKSDAERSEKFYKVLKLLDAKGVMGDLDDGPDQIPLEETDVENTILKLLPAIHFDIIISHNPTGEYTKHLRHEEISRAVIKLWNKEKISADELLLFAYEDGNKKYFPKPVAAANIQQLLNKKTWLKKYNLIKDTYGFKKDSWEAQTCPKGEAFWRFTNPEDAMLWLENCGTMKHTVL